MMSHSFFGKGSECCPIMSKKNRFRHLWKEHQLNKNAFKSATNQWTIHLKSVATGRRLYMKVLLSNPLWSSSSKADMKAAMSRSQGLVHRDVKHVFAYSNRWLFSVFNQIVECFPNTMPPNLPDILGKIKWTKEAKDVETWENWWEALSSSCWLVRTGCPQFESLCESLMGGGGGGDAWVRLV